VANTPESVTTFFRGRRFAVAGVSRRPNQAANAVFRKLRDVGYEVFPTNPQTSEVEGAKCYSHVGSVPGQLDGVVIATAQMSQSRSCGSAALTACAECGSIVLLETAVCPRRLFESARRAASTASLGAAR